MNDTTAPRAPVTSGARHDSGDHHGAGHRHGGVLSIAVSRWPTAAGLLALLATANDGVDPHVLAMIIILAAMCYLAAAAIGSRVSGWVMVGVATVAVTVAMATGLDATLLLLIMAAGFAAFGLLRGGRIDRRELGIQSAGFAGFAAIALSAMYVGPVVAAHLAAAASVGHAVIWDAWHYRRDRVVTRSLTEACFVFDLGLGAVLLGATWLTMLS